jgi:hypothetical protein
MKKDDEVKQLRQITEEDLIAPEEDSSVPATEQIKQTPHELMLEFQGKLMKYSDEELINAFNREVGNNGWCSARGSYLTAMHNEFDRRRIDYRAVGDSVSLCFRQKVSLVNKCLKVLE